MPDVAVDARGQHRRAAAHRLHHHVRAAFHRGSGAPAHARAWMRARVARMRQRAEPAVVRACAAVSARGLGARARGRARRRCGRAGCRRAPASRRAAREVGLRVLLVAQVADHQRAQVARRSWPACAARGAGLEARRAHLARSALGQRRGAQLVAAPPAGRPARSERCAPASLGDVAVQVGAGQHHAPAAGAGAARAQAAIDWRRAARVQRDHHVGLVAAVPVPSPGARDNRPPACAPSAARSASCRCWRRPAPA